MSHRPPAAADDGRQGGGAGDIGNGFIYGLLHRRLWLEALAGVAGIDLTPAEPVPVPEPADHRWMYEAILAQLREVVVPAIADPLAASRGKGMARLIKYLAQVDAHGQFFEGCELRDLEELLGRRPPTIAVGRAEVATEVRCGRLSDGAYLGYLWRRVARQTELARPAMGVLADRHWPSLT